MIAISITVALVIYVWVTIKATRWLASVPSTFSAKRLITLSSAAIFIVLPILDEIAGRIYFRHLCETEGGIEVYKTVELGPEYWNPDGSGKFITVAAEREGKLLVPGYSWKSEWNRDFNKMLNIAKQQYSVVEVSTGAEIASKIFFVNFHGWLTNHSFAHVTGDRCPSLDAPAYRRLLERVFVKRVQLQGGMDNEHY
jgi:hypothetical protein